MDTAIKTPARELLACRRGHADDSSRTHASRSRGHVGRPTAAEEAFNAVFDSSSEALALIDSAGTIQRANLGARELLRLQHIGKRRSRVAEIFPGAHSDNFFKLWNQAAEPVPRTMNVHLRTGAPLRITLRAILPESQHLLLCLEEGSVVQKAELRWQRVESEIRGILDSIRAAIVLCSATGHIRFFNARFGELLGLNPLDLKETRTFNELSELIAPRFRRPENFAAPWLSFVEGGGKPGRDELEITQPALRVIERFFRPVLDLEGSAIGWLERYSDVTIERQTQSKVLQTEKMAALGQLVSGIAHELNNPLTAIMGYAQLLLGKGLASPQPSEAEKVFQEAERARRIVKNLLYFARETRCERTRVDLNEIIERTVALRSYELRVENITVECNLAPQLPHTLADPYQLQQVVLNLLINSEQALLESRGRGRVWIRTRHVIGGAGDQARDHIVLQVADDGPGIPPEIASRIFDPFFTSKPSGVGTGLGLSIVYGIVHQHGGEVAFDNEPGSGARFIVHLPVIEAPAEPPPEALTPAARRYKAVAQARILAIEDEPTVAQLIVDVLREEGHQVEAVLESQEGLRRLARNQYDLIVCDLRMPHFDGQAIYQSLQRAGSPLLSRILFITGDVLAPRTREFLEPNRVPYLAKPFLVEELKLAVNQLLDPSRGLASKSDSASPSGSAGSASRAKSSSAARTARR